MKVVVTGCFDPLHSGHVYFFEKASRHGDLYVVVGCDAAIYSLKGNPRQPENERLYMVQSCKYVHEARLSTGTGIVDARREIELISPDIWIVNGDQDYTVKRELAKVLNIRYVVHCRDTKAGLPIRSSTTLVTSWQN